MKKSRSKFLPSVFAVVFGVVTFLGLAFNFVIETVSGGRGNYSSSRTESWTMSEWFDFLKDNESDKLATWNFAKVLFIITLVVIAIVAILALVQLFVDSKILRLVEKIASIAGIALSVLFILMFIIGGCVFAKEYTGSIVGIVDVQTTLLPNVGPIVVALGGVLAGVCGLVSNLNRKKK